MNLTKELLTIEMAASNANMRAPQKDIKNEYPATISRKERNKRKSREKLKKISRRKNRVK